MADASDVANVLKSIVVATVYPNGTSQPSIVGVTVGIERGWPIPNELQSQLAAGQCIVSIFDPPGMERNTTRYERDDQVVAAPVHTLTAFVAGNTITIGGTVQVPQNVIAVCGGRFAFSYQVQANDTLNTIAAGLAALIAAQFPGTAASGAVITVAGKPGILQARIAAVGQVWTEQGRQEKVFWIVCWCPTPQLRDQLAPAIDLPLRQLDRITMPDQGSARLIYHSSREIDDGEKNDIYRRDLLYSVEYAAATVTNAFEVGTVSVSGLDALRVNV
ncbi:hypothetical protein [Bradyrhizobium sp.]|uniref:hypothetical protein n=1 Tax=Bradyrhizobium sp. TaxID=376 RepID=UPI001D564CC7|nr:hypothetical protein [Bradyrhizobium sp.]MBV8697381.1 hypothetical protein [Bradyrhizobium sp.]MBV9984509.1 hypothetical protein [Bradyrhizobium sp.]